MKKITTQGVLEEAQYFCDKHPDRECFSELKTCSWCGSKFDMTGIEIHLCDECLEEMYKLLREKFEIEPKDIIEM
jgi:hypothetical protein